jgi:hypothetical protein
MMIFKKSISRRAMLRGVGASFALPMLDAMVPAFAEAAPSLTPTRIGFVYFPNGAIPSKWKPTTVGSNFELTQILKPMAPFKDSMMVISGLDNLQAKGIYGEAGGEHPRASAAYLTCVHPYVKTTEGEYNKRVGISLDQIYAREYGKHTQLASLELGIESDAVVGSCDGDSCSYNSTISWRDETTPMPIQNQPRAVFERLFGDSDSTNQADRMARLQERKSLLDFVGGATKRMMKDLGATDREKLDQYLEATRDVERRIQRAEEQSMRELPDIKKPAGIPQRFDDHAKLLFDLMVLAYQTDLTRVGTYMMGREMSTMAYPEIGVPDPYHPLTHHQGDVEKINKAGMINVYHASLFSYFLERLRDTPDGDGTLLDHSLLTYGGGLGDANMHEPRDLPIVMVSDGKHFQGGRHVQYPKETPLANLYLRMMDMTNMPLEKFGDSTEQLNLLKV